MADGRRFRVVWGIGSLIAVESLLVGFSALPGLLTWRFLLNLPVPVRGKYLETALLGVAFVPAYLVFAGSLMVLTGVATRLLGWRASRGSYSVAATPWVVVRWAQYNGAIHVVRIFAGHLFRATPLWTWFVRFNGARVGRHVHINTVSIYDHNLLTMGDGVVLGSDVKISAHVVEGDRVNLAPVQLGKAVTVGTNSIVLPGVVVGDGAVIGAMSLVPKDARLAPGGTYAGVPVRRLSSPERPA